LTICRFDDGHRQHNIETTNTGNGGVSMPPDAYYYNTPRYKLLPEHVASGSDLRALRPREMLGTFFGSRGRHWHDIREAHLARRDFAIALEFYPTSRIYSRILKEVNEIVRLHGLRAQRKMVEEIAPLLSPAEIAAYTYTYTYTMDTLGCTDHDPRLVNNSLRRE
jgi:hypothetical protein